VNHVNVKVPLQWRTPTRHVTDEGD